MSQPFDPYRIWFGIPPQHQPPNHYRLLGIEVFESDADVVEHAADQRMAHLKTFAAGKHSALSQKLLNEVAAARVCLLNATDKAKYDEALRAQLSQQASVAPVTVAIANAATDRDDDSGTFDSFAATLSAPSKPRAAGAGSATHRQAAHKPQQKKKQPSSTWLALAISGVAIAILAVVVIANLGKDSGTQVASGGANEKGAATTDPLSRHSVTQPDNSSQQPVKPDAGKTNMPDPAPAQPKDDPPKKDTSLVNPPDEANPRKDDPPVKPDDPPVKPDDPPKPVIKLKNPPPPALDEQPVDEPPLAPEGQPIQPRPQKPVTPRQPDLPKKAPPVRQSVPEDDAIKAAEKEIRELFKDSIKEATKPEAKLDLAAKLKRTALESNDSPASQYALLRMAANYYVDGNDPQAALPLMDQIARRFDENAVDLKVALLAKADAAAAKAGPQAAQGSLALARQLVEDSLVAGEIEAASQCLKTALNAAIRVKDVAVRKQIQDSIKDLDRIRPQAPAAKKALEQLKTEPGDPTANAEAGKWNCFVCGDWRTGLPQLAKGDDETLRELAKTDLTNPMETEKQVSLGEAWLQQAAEKKGLEQARIREHAATWYRKAMPKLAGLEREKAEQKLEKAGVRVSGHALKFNGTKSYVSVKNFAYPPNQPITVEVIVKFEANDSSYFQTIFGTGSYPGFHLARSYGSFSFDFSSSDSTTIMQKWVPSKPGVWNHVAIEYDGTKKRLFVNGQETNQRSANGPYQASTNPLLIGAQPSRGTSSSPSVPTQFFTGEIRGLRVSNGVRFTKDFTPPAELTSDAGTVLLFQFNEGKGNVLKDSSGRSKLQGEIINAQWVKVDDLSIGGEAKVVPAAPLGVPKH